MNCDGCTARIVRPCRPSCKLKLRLARRCIQWKANGHAECGAPCSNRTCNNNAELGCDGTIAFVAAGSAVRGSLYSSAPAIRQLARCSVAAVMLLPALWVSLAVNPATPARRPRPNGVRSRVSRNITWVGQAHEAIDLFVSVVDENSLFVPASDTGALGHPPSPPRDFSPDAECRVAALSSRLDRFSFLLPVSARGPPLVNSQFLL